MRRKTRLIKIGSRKIGGSFPVLVQSMCNTDTKDVAATVAQIHALEEAGCDIVRVAVPDMGSAKALKEIKRQVGIPVVADIHFDYRLAVEAAKYADKIRINPGNIGSEEKIRKIVVACRGYSIPIRVGVNSGSLSKEVAAKFGNTPQGLFESAKQSIALMEKLGFENLVVSIKSPDLLEMVQANKLFSEKFNYPLHLGVTEAGPAEIGALKSAMGIGFLLMQGIGDTIRVSLTENPVQEVFVGREILKSLGMRKGRQFISCPTCARTSTNLLKIAAEIERATRNDDRDIRIAVMGCEVNGPGEAKHADIGVACAKGFGYIFRKGKITKKASEKEIVNEFLKEYEKL